MIAFTEEILNGKLHFLCSGYPVESKFECQQDGQKKAWAVLLNEPVGHSDNATKKILTFSSAKMALKLV